MRFPHLQVTRVQRSPPRAYTASPPWGDPPRSRALHVSSPPSAPPPVAVRVPRGRCAQASSPGPAAPPPVPLLPVSALTKRQRHGPRQDVERRHCAVHAYVYFLFHCPRVPAGLGHDPPFPGGILPLSQAGAHSRLRRGEPRCLLTPQELMGHWGSEVAPRGGGAVSSGRDLWWHLAWAAPPALPITSLLWHVGLSGWSVAPSTPGVGVGAA